MGCLVECQSYAARTQVLHERQQIELTWDPISRVNQDYAKDERSRGEVEQCLIRFLWAHMRTILHVPWKRVRLYAPVWKSQRMESLMCLFTAKRLMIGIGDWISHIFPTFYVVSCDHRPCSRCNSGHWRYVGHGTNLSISDVQRQP